MTRSQRDRQRARDAAAYLDRVAQSQYGFRLAEVEAHGQVVSLMHRDDYSLPRCTTCGQRAQVRP